MYNKYFFCNYKIFFLPAFLILIASFLGSLCCSGSASYSELNIYLSDFLANVGNVNKFNVSLGNLDEMLFIFFAIFFSAFLKFGVIINSLVVLRRSFIIGYTLTAFLKAFGTRGIIAIFAMLPEVVLFISLLILFSSAAINMSFKKNEKNNLIFFLFFSVFAATIFCGFGFLNGYFTTTFMSIVSSKIA